MAEQASPKAFVRPYNPETDLNGAVEAFRVTCDASLQYEPAVSIGEYLWCRPYVQLCPRTCFVVDDGHGKAVGYIIATPDTAQFCEDWKAKFIPKISGELESRTSPYEPLDDRCKGLLRKVHDPWESNDGDMRDLLKPWPAHLHIDIAPSHQNQGLGKVLVNTLLEALKAQGCSGVYLGMTAWNDGAGRFYQRNGFRRLPHVMDGGKSGEEGRREGTIWFVKDL